MIKITETLKSIKNSFSFIRVFNKGFQSVRELEGVRVGTETLFLLGKVKHKEIG